MDCHKGTPGSLSLYYSPELEVARGPPWPPGLQSQPRLQPTVRKSQSGLPRSFRGPHIRLRLSTWRRGDTVFHWEVTPGGRLSPDQGPGTHSFIQQIVPQHHDVPDKVLGVPEFYSISLDLDLRMELEGEGQMVRFILSKSSLVSPCFDSESFCRIFITSWIIGCQLCESQVPAT